MATRTLRHGNRKAPTRWNFLQQSRERIFHEVTWFVEALMLASTLFWAIEANAAQEVQWQPTWLELETPTEGGTRSPAAESKTKAKKLRIPHRSYSSILDQTSARNLSYFQMSRSFIERKLQASEQVVTGTSVSATFKTAPVYAPTTLTVFRFRTH